LSEFVTGETALALHPASDKNPAGSVELGFTVADAEALRWLKTIALLRKLRHRGTLGVDWIFAFACVAYNLVRMRNLMRSAVPAQCRLWCR
jgi:hypothetical protein